MRRAWRHKFQSSGPTLSIPYILCLLCNLYASLAHLLQGVDFFVYQVIIKIQNVEPNQEKDISMLFEIFKNCKNVKKDW